MPFIQTVRELVSQGVIPAEALEIVNRARELRSQLVHTKAPTQPYVADIEKLLAFEKYLRGELGGAVAG